MQDGQKEFWRKHLGITEENTVDEEDMEGEWEDVRELRQGNGRTQEASRSNH